jgi:hypothetical protein
VKKLMFANLAMVLAAMAAGQAKAQQYAPSYSYGASSFPVSTVPPPVHPQNTVHGTVPQGFMQVPQVPSLQAGYHQPTATIGHGQPYGTEFNSGFPSVPSQPLYQLASTQEGYGFFPTPEPVAQGPMGQGPMGQGPLPGMGPAFGPAQGNHPGPGQAVAPGHVPAVGHHHAPFPALAPLTGGHPSGGTFNQNPYHQVAPGCATCGSAPVSQGFNHFGDSCGGPVAFNAPGLSNGFPRTGGFGFGHGLAGRHHQHWAGLPGGAKPWFFGANYLNFHRIDDKSRPLSLRTADSWDMLSTGDARHGSISGFQLMGGRYFNCGRNAVQVVYWGLYPENETAHISMPGGVYRTRILGMGDVSIDYNPGIPGPMPGYDVYDWFDGAQAHYVNRSSEFHNVEVNLLGFGVGGAARNFNRAVGGGCCGGGLGARHGGQCGYCGGAGCGACHSAQSQCGPACEPTRFATGPCCYIAPTCGSRLNLSWLGGFRYFRFEDNLQYAADFAGDGLRRDANDLYYDVNTTNDLVGFQWGGRGDFCLGRRVNLFALGKVGIYNNHATLRSRIGTDMMAAYQANLPGNMPYVVDVSDNRFATLSELGTGLGFCLSPKWTANIGYSAIVASGVATAPGNIRERGQFLRDQRYINNSDVLILHGINIGANYNF